MTDFWVVQCPFCFEPRVVRTADLLIAEDPVRFRSCDAACFVAYSSGLRERLRWDVSWMRKP